MTGMKTVTGWHRAVVVCVLLLATSVAADCTLPTTHNCHLNGYQCAGTTHCQCFREFEGTVCEKVSTALRDQGDTAYIIMWVIMCLVTAGSLMLHLCMPSRVSLRHKWGIGLLPIIWYMQLFALVVAYNSDLRESDLFKPFRRSLVALFVGVNDTQENISNDTGELKSIWHNLAPKIVVLVLTALADWFFSNRFKFQRVFIRHRHFTWIYMLLFLPALDSLFGGVQLSFQETSILESVSSLLVLVLVLGFLLLVLYRYALPQLNAGPLMFLFPGNGWVMEDSPLRAASVMHDDWADQQGSSLEIDRAISGIQPRTEEDYTSFDDQSRLRKLSRKHKIKHDNIQVWHQFGFAALFEDSVYYELQE